MIQINKQPGQKVIEFGAGGNVHPQTDVATSLHMGPGIHFAVDLEKPFTEEHSQNISSDEFDCALALFCLEHVSWRVIPQTLKEIHRVIKPGGKLILVLPNTEAQMQFILNKPEWDGDEGSMLFGGQLDGGDRHLNPWSPRWATKLLTNAGFTEIQIQPISYNPSTPPGDETDMAVTATKPLNPLANAFPALNPFLPLENAPNSDLDALPSTPVGPATPPVTIPQQLLPQGPNHTGLTSEQRAALYNRAYFDVGGGFAGQAFCWDVPHNETVFRNVMARRPESVLELGCGRGYVLKRLKDAGIRVQGIDISKHCELTKVCQYVLEKDLTQPWGFSNESFDLCLSVAFLEHIPEPMLPALFAEMQRVSKRGLHGVSFTHNQHDATQCTLRDKLWWQERLPAGHEVMNVDDLRAGELPADYLKGDGKVKLNIGCAWTMFHSGWKNIDVIDASQFAAAYKYDFQRHDVRNGLPFQTGTVDLIFTAHMLEHLTFSEGAAFLKECRRVIKPTGAMRVIVPDAEMLMEAYRKAAIEPTLLTRDIKEFDELNLGCAEAPTPAGKLYALLYENHKACYDDGTLCRMLEEAGWDAWQTAPFSEYALGSNGNPNTPSIQQILRETLDVLPSLSLFAAAVPKLG